MGKLRDKGKEKQRKMNMEKRYYLSYKELVEKYFNLKEFKVEENAPKLSKQLSRAKIEHKQEELQAFSELLLSIFSDEKELVYTFVLSNVLPCYQDANDWAFDDSCNTPGGAGEITSVVLQTSDLARYCYIYNELNSPKARFYYFETEEGELGLSDLYSWEGHGFYLAPQILLAIFYNKRLSDFKETTSVIVDCDNEGGFWSNMASSNYKKFVTSLDIKAKVDLSRADSVLAKEGFQWSERQDRYINLDDSDYVYCDNIEDFEDSYYVTECSECGCPMSTEGDYHYVDDEYFCSESCLEDACQWSNHYSDYILNDEANTCEDCEEVFYGEDLEEGSDGCLYCSDCIHDHLEDEEEIA